MEETVKMLKERIEMLTQAVPHSMANHNALVGRLEEAKDLLKETLQKMESSKADGSPV